MLDKNTEVFNVVFDAAGTTKLNWINQNKIISSTFPDIKLPANKGNVFSVQG